MTISNDYSLFPPWNLGEKYYIHQSEIKRTIKEKIMVKALKMISKIRHPSPYMGI